MKILFSLSLKCYLLTCMLGLLLVPVRVPAQESPQAMYDKGCDLLNMYSAPPNLRLEGWSLMERAAKAGNLNAKIEVAQLDAGFLTVMTPIDGQRLLKPNLDRALAYFRDAAKTGHAGSMMHLALLYSSGIGEPRDESESPHNLLLAAAMKGNAEAMQHLSNRYLYGHGEKVDMLESARWRYLAWQRNPVEQPEWVDDEGNPKIQDNLPRTELTETLSLLVKSVEFKNPEAIAALRKRYVEAGKPQSELDSLLRKRPVTVD